MYFKPKQNKTIAAVAIAVVTIIGCYNAVVINSDSHIAQGHFVKRLDETLGVILPGRFVASSYHWQKLMNKNEAKIAVLEKPIIQHISKSVINQTKNENTEILAAIQDEINLSLVEVINARKWQQGLQPSQFSGSLSANSGMIEALNVTLPNGEGMTLSFSEMKGNVFSYESEGETYSGMMYQIDQGCYMITLTNGPLEGTRLKFGSDNKQQAQEFVAETDVPVGTFGEAAPVSEIIEDTNVQVQPDALQAQSFNFNQQSM